MTDPDFVWFADVHYIDFILLVSARLGLHAILPNTASDPGYVWRLQLHQPCNTFRLKFTRLGFDAAHRMLFAGYQGQENVWIAMAPKNTLQTMSVHEPIHGGSTDTRLAHRHYLALLAWFAHLLSSCGIGQVFNRRTYADITSMESLKRTTNILYIP